MAGQTLWTSLPLFSLKPTVSLAALCANWSLLATLSFQPLFTLRALATRNARWPSRARVTPFAFLTSWPLGTCGAERTRRPLQTGIAILP